MPTVPSIALSSMSVVLNLTIPFFALIFLGMFCRAVGFVDQRDARMMAKYAFFIAMPLMAVFFTVAFVRFVLLTFLVIMPIAIGFVATGRNKTCYK